MYYIVNIETGKFLTKDDVHEMHYSYSLTLAKQFDTIESAYKETDIEIEIVVNSNAIAQT